MMSPQNQDIQKQKLYYKNIMIDHFIPVDFKDFSFTKDKGRKVFSCFACEERWSN